MPINNIIDLITALTTTSDSTTKADLLIDERNISYLRSANFSELLPLFIHLQSNPTQHLLLRAIYKISAGTFTFTQKLELVLKAPAIIENTEQLTDFLRLIPEHETTGWFGYGPNKRIALASACSTTIRSIEGFLAVCQNLPVNSLISDGLSFLASSAATLRLSTSSELMTIINSLGSNTSSTFFTRHYLKYEKVLLCGWENIVLSLTVAFSSAAQLLPLFRSLNHVRDDTGCLKILKLREHLIQNVEQLASIIKTLDYHLCYNNEHLERTREQYFLITNHSPIEEMIDRHRNKIPNLDKLVILLASLKNSDVQFSIARKYFDRIKDIKALLVILDILPATAMNKYSSTKKPTHIHIKRCLSNRAAFINVYLEHKALITKRTEFEEIAKRLVDSEERRAFKSLHALIFPELLPAPMEGDIELPTISISFAPSGSSSISPPPITLFHRTQAFPHIAKRRPAAGGAGAFSSSPGIR